MGNRAQLNMLGTYIPIALVWLGATFKEGWTRYSLDIGAIVLTTFSTIIWYRLAKRRRL